jgi:secreted trypsin-like serine protease
MWRFFLLFAVCSSALAISIDKKIVGGQNADTNQFPYQASLRNRETSFHFCGGFIINARWVGSSYRCTFWRQPAENILVVVGAVTLSSGGSFHQAIRIVGHPEYRAEGFGTYENDISLVQVKDSFVFSASVAPIALGTTFIGGGVNGIFAG